MRHLLTSCFFACVLVSTIAEAQSNSAAQCKNLPKIANGSVSRAASGNQYSLVCNSGYMVSGNASATCTVTAAGEHWASTFGACMAVCLVPPIANGSVVYTSGQPASGNIMTNTNVSVKCNPGSTLVGYANNHCGISATGGTWSLSFGSCSNSCKLPAVQNAQVLDSTGKPAASPMPPNTSYTVKCNAGFVPPPGATTHGACNPAGVLSGQPSSCVQSIAVDCPQTIQITQADFGTNNGGYLKYSPADWKLSAGAALALTLPLTSINVDNGIVLNCGYSSPSGMANLTKQVSQFGTKCVTGSSGKSFVCYK
jgi:hypothetical protein